MSHPAIAPETAINGLAQADQLPATLHLGTPSTLEQATSQRDMLAAAGYKLLVALGFVRTDAPCTATALLLALDDAANQATTPTPSEAPSFAAILRTIEELPSFQSGDPAVHGVHADLTALHHEMKLAFQDITAQVTVSDVVMRMNSTFEDAGIEHRVTWYPADHADGPDVIHWDNDEDSLPAIEARFNDTTVSVHTGDGHAQEEVASIPLTSTTSAVIAGRLSEIFLHSLKR